MSVRKKTDSKKAALTKVDNGLPKQIRLEPARVKRLTEKATIMQKNIDEAVQRNEMLFIGAQSLILEDTLIENKIPEQDWGKYMLSKDRSILTLKPE